MAYMAYADLVDASSVDALTAASAAEQEAWCTAARSAVEQFCGQTFTEDDRTRTLDGNDERRLPLEVRLATITGLALTAPETWSSLALTDVAITDDHDALYVIPDAASGGTWATKIMRAGRPAIFPAGAGTVEVTGIWGWLDADMPASLAAPPNVAILREMEDMAMAKVHGLSDSVRGAARLGLSQVIDGRVSATINRSPIVLSPESQQALGGLVWDPPGFGA